MIFDIQRFSIHDGPGIRSTVFFKGCTMDCRWCQNPESIRPGKEMAVYRDRCIGCGLCADTCPKEAISAGSPGRINWRLCDCCGICAKTCPADALVLVGREITDKDLLVECMADRPFYNRSGGGVTLSGGEPVLQSAFLSGFLPLLRDQSIHVILETAGHYVFSTLEPLLPMLDCIYFDVKMADPEDYRAMTGGDMALILANLAVLKKRGVPLTVRIPVLPGLNTAPDQIARIGRTLWAIGIRDLQLLAYNPFWESKLFRLQTEKRPLMLSDKDIDYRHIADEFAKTGITPVLPAFHGTRDAG
jgi:pyruvate formate lyase activating enzyme